MKIKISHIMIATVLTLMVGIFYALLSMNQRALSSRAPQSLLDRIPIVGFLANGASVATTAIYNTGSTIVEVPYEEIKKLVIKIGLHSYLSGLVDDGFLDQQTKDRVSKRLADPEYAGKIFPFLFALKNQYTAEDTSIRKYQDFARESYPTSFKGDSWNEHTHFSWEDKQKKKEGGLNINGSIIGMGIKLYDVIFIQGDSVINKDLNGSYKPISLKEIDMIHRTQKIVKKLLGDLVKTMDSGDMSDMIKFMLLDTEDGRNRLQAATISVIDFVRESVHKNYHYFANNFARKNDLHAWLSKKYSKNSPDILAYLDYANNKRKYAVHIAVDGLQGSLARSLSSPQKNDPFLTQTLADHEDKSKYKPDDESSGSPKHNYTWEFLQHLESYGYESEQYMPYFKKIFSDYGNSIAQNGVATTPTISVRNLPIVKTGADAAGPNSTGVPNFHFLDRPNHRAYYFFGNDALQLNQLTSDAGMKTMFERLREYNTLNCNAQYDWYASTSFDALVNLGVGEAIRDFGDYLCMVELYKRAEVEKSLRSDRETLKAKIQAYNDSYWPLTKYFLHEKIKQLITKVSENEVHGMPQYLLYYNPWPDHFSHFVGPFSNEIISPTGEYNRLDYWLGKLSKAYEDAGISDRTLYGMAGDHGLSPIFYLLNPEKAVLDKLNEKLDFEIVIKKISADEGEGPKITNALNSPNFFKDKVDVVVASTAGGNYMIDVFNSYTDEKIWATQPLYSELTQWRPHNAPDSFQMDIVKEFANGLKKSLEYLVVRETPSNFKEGKIRIVAHRKGQKHTEFITRKGDQIFYHFQVDKGSLLQLDTYSQYRKTTSSDKVKFKKLFHKCVTAAVESDLSSWCNESTWRDLASYTPKPDSVVQLSHLYDSDRAGTINLFPNTGIGYNTKVPGRHAGEHFHEKDAFVGFWGEPVRGTKTKLRNVVNGSVAPTLFEYLVSEDPQASRQVKKGLHGWGFESVYKKISEPSE